MVVRSPIQASYYVLFITLCYLFNSQPLPSCLARHPLRAHLADDRPPLDATQVVMTAIASGPGRPPEDRLNGQKSCHSTRNQQWARSPSDEIHWTPWKNQRGTEWSGANEARCLNVLAALASREFAIQCRFPHHTAISPAGWAASGAATTPWIGCQRVEIVKGSVTHGEMRGRQGIVEIDKTATEIKKSGWPPWQSQELPRQRHCE